MKKLNEKELSKITGGFGMFFDPTVSFYMKRKKRKCIVITFKPV
ncbi:bacteriocin [Lactobacillus sp. LL6]|nr:bacteriocin [Lactobacillus sp. LL6]TSO26991.1 bacteriocin [Lactobacillus sp. LL6]